MAFDVRDESGASLPMLTRAETEGLTKEILGAIVASVGAIADEDLLAEVAAPGPAADAAERLCALVEAAAPEAAYRWLITLLDTNFLILVDARQELVGRRVFKISYENEARPRMSVLSRLGVLPARFEFRSAAMNFGFPYHAELVPPEGSVVTAAFAEARPGSRADGVARTGDYAISHLYVAPGDLGDQATDPRVVFKLAPAPDGLLRTAALANLLSTALLVAGGLHLGVLRERRPGEEDAVAAVLLLVPAVLSSFLVREEHSVVSELVRYIRSAALIQSALLLTSAGMLVVRPDQLDEWWTGFTFASLAISAVIVSATLLATARVGPAVDRNDQRRRSARLGAAALAATGVGVSAWARDLDLPDAARQVGVAFGAAFVVVDAVISVVTAHVRRRAGLYSLVVTAAAAIWAACEADAQFALAMLLIGAVTATVIVRISAPDAA